MKRILVVLGLVAVAGLVLSNIELSAQDSSKAGPPAMQAKHGANFVDENGNGLCDRYEQGTPMGQHGDHMKGHGANFIDENGDGICDNAGTGSQRHGHHAGNGRMGNGARCGR